MSKKTQLAEKILGKDITAQLCQWYEYALQGKWNYVVFVVRRSYILALLLEKITGKVMEESSKTSKFLTDASLILQCKNMADAYKKTGKFPSILLCDELLLHGRTLNHIIDTLEGRLAAFLPGYEQEEIRHALASAVCIHVYVRTEEDILLYGRYEENMRCMRREDAGFLHAFSSDLSELILCSGISNASYVFSRYISDETMEMVRSQEDLIHTEYQNAQEYTLAEFTGTGSLVKAVFTLRFVKVRGGEGYRAVPFVFLPNLDKDTTDLLLEQVKERIPGRDFSALVQLFDRIPGKRSLNEFLTMIFSNVLLTDFLERYQIEICPKEEGLAGPVKEEIQKLARNYNFNTLRQAWNCLNDVLFQKPFTKREMAAMFEGLIPDKCKVLEIQPGLREHAASRKSIIRRLESYFYERGWQEEWMAHKLISSTSYISTRRSERKARGCCFLLTELCKGYTAREAKQSIAYFLQMMDAGVLSLSSYAPNHIDVVGYAQYAKAGEMSLLLEPLRYFLYIPMLAMMQSECRKWHVDLHRELQKFSDRMDTGIDREKADQLWGFAQNTEEIGQNVSEWEYEGYLRKIKFESEEEEQDYKERRCQLKADYEKYLKL